jgi:predicted nuclease of restriction endonuclease-like (RecB) superfamily
MTKKKSPKVQSSSLNSPGPGSNAQSVHTVRGEFYDSIAQVLRAARCNAYRAINFVMVEAYWSVGRMIVEEEQLGKGRAEYGRLLMSNLSRRLTAEFGNGFGETNLKYFRQFYLTYPVQSAEQIRHTLCDELTWSHYRLLMRVEKPDARQWYMIEAADQNWSVRSLQRQINSLYYERLLMSRHKTPVIDEMLEKTSRLVPLPEDFIKDPYVLEFLGMPDAHQFREAELEQAIIGKLQAFMLELGKGFAFVARQHRISTETKDFFIDLVFYNYILKCFLLIDLKTGELTHEDIGKNRHGRLQLNG